MKKIKIGSRKSQLALWQAQYVKKKLREVHGDLEVEVIGITTSGAYGHYVSKSLAFAYVRAGYETAGTQFDIKILGGRCKATVLSEPAWDPKNVRPSS